MSLRDLIFRDFWLKLASLVAAVFIWFTVSAASRKEIEVASYPVMAPKASQTFRNQPVLVVWAAPGGRHFTVRPDHVDVTVRGDSDLIAKLRPKDVRVLVDLTGIEAAEGLRKQVDVSAPPGVTFVRAEPDAVEVMVPPKP